MSYSICLGPIVQLPQQAIDLLIKNGHLPPPAPPAATTAPANAAAQPVSAAVSQIWHALTDRPLNDRQALVLEILWRAKRDGEPALSIEEVARRLAAAGTVDPARAVDFVKGAYRSFGRRLFQTLAPTPVKIDVNAKGEGVADEIPLLALMSIETGPSGENRHRLTDDGFIAVDAALGMTAKGHAAGGIQTGDPELDDPNAIVRPAMSRLSHALLLRVQASMGLTFDATIKALAGLAGAG